MNDHGARRAESQEQPQKSQEYYTDMPVGEILRRAREHHGRSLRDVEADLRIRKIQIEAIETGNLEKLPGRVYAIGFVRSYAEYLGLDGDQIVQLFKSQSLGNRGRPALNFPVAASESRLPPVWLVMVGLVMAVLLVAFWSSYQMDQGSPVIPSLEQQASAPQRQQEPPAPAVPAPVQQAALSPAPADVPQPAVPDPAEAALQAVPGDNSQIRIYRDPQTGQSAAERVVPDPYASASSPDAAQDPAAQQEGGLAAEAPQQPGAEVEGPPAPPAGADEAAQTADAAPAAPEQQEAQRGITLNVLENSWVEIRDQSGRAIVSRVLNQGDQYFVPDRPDLLMSLGNAGGVQIILDNQPLPLLGERGQVRRNISLDLNALKNLAGTPE